jgi:hypothetical protein
MVSKALLETIKKETLEQLGNPTHYYEVNLNRDGWYVEESKIDKVDLEARLSGGFTIKFNGRYVTQSDYMFDKEKAYKFCKERNLEYWQEKKEDALITLAGLDEERINAEKTIEIANLKLKKLGVEQ